jgi:hypothetical protein
MVLPVRWVPCIQMNGMVFGVGGWGFAVLVEMLRLGELDPTVSRYSILKPGTHYAAAGITRHIGSQVANPARWWSNPVPWLGPGRQNQLGFNMRKKAEVDVRLALTREPSRACSRSDAHWTELDKQACTARPHQLPPPPQLATAAPTPPTAVAEGMPVLLRCPKKKGAQQPFAIASFSPSVGARVGLMVGKLTGLQSGSVHEQSLAESEYGGMVVMHIHTTDLLVRRRAADPVAEAASFTTGAYAPAALDPKSMFYRGKDRGQTVWDGVVVLLDPDPAGTIVEWAVVQAGGEVGWLSAATEGEGGLHAAKLRLQPVVDQYIAFYNYWHQTASIGPAFVQVLDLTESGGDGSAEGVGYDKGEGKSEGGEGGSTAVEMMRLVEIMQQVKLGHHGRWCKGAPKRSFCCGAAHPVQRAAAAPGGVLVPPALHAWLAETTADVAVRMQRVWRAQLVGLGADLPEAGTCCRT